MDEVRESILKKLSDNISKQFDSVFLVEELYYHKLITSYQRKRMKESAYKIIASLQLSLDKLLNKELS